MIKVKDIITAGGLGDPTNVRLQQLVGKRLAARGFRPVVRRIDGVAQRVWVRGESVTLPDAAVVDEAIEGAIGEV